MLRALTTALLLLGATASLAQTVTGPDRPATFIARGLVQNFIMPAVAQRPAQERMLLRQVEIRVTPGGPFPGPQAGVSGGNRLVLLPEIFVIQLQAHVEASIYAEVSDQPYFAQWWLDYALWRSPIFGSISDGPFYRGEAPKRPLLFAGMNAQQANDFVSRYKTQISGIFNAALIDILLHELGHHAIDRWYTSGETPSSQARAIEKAADEWATTAYQGLVKAHPKAGFVDNQNVAGRLFAIEYVFGLSRWQSTTHVEAGIAHPAFVTRVSSAASSSECGALAETVASFCEAIGDRVKTMGSQAEAEKDYRARASKGESFAAYRLGRILLARGDYKNGCDLMLSAKGRRAAHYAGWCLEFSHAGTALSDEVRKRMAVKAYEVGANLGWADSIWGLKRLGAIP